MSPKSQVREACLYLTDLLCDLTKPWSEVKIYFEEWLKLIRLWKEYTTQSDVTYLGVPK